MAKMAKTTAIRTGEASPPLLSRHVSQGPADSTLKFRLLHFWEARKNVKGGPGILLGIELLMIDAEGTLAQGFIGLNRRNQYEKELKRGSIYTLTNFYASNSKVMYHVADQRLVICISHASALSRDEEDDEGILTERFRVRSFSGIEANCDLRGDLHDVVGHLTLVDGQALHERPVLFTNDNAASRKVMVHLQLKDGPVMNVYLWDEAAESFRVKFDASASTPTVLLVTTVNPKRLGGKLCLNSMSSSRVFLDEEVDPSKEYLAWLATNPAVTSLVNPVEVVKAETLTIGEIAAFIKRQPPQVAYFDCIATIDDVKLGTEWYYIACKDYQTKLNRGPTTLLCPKCGNENATAENGGDEAEIEVPLPQCFIDAIGQTKKFRIKVAHYNFTSTRLSLTATKIVSAAELPPKNPPLKMLPGTEVENTELAEGSGGGASATEEEKKAKRTKRSG
uniref:Replication factor A C-terminal domain-containing protein n=1 Tax=Brassica campestris TaxID=3711 RepID=M4DB51_BRACM